MANRTPFKDAVKATKLLDFAIQTQMLLAGEFPKHHNLALLVLSSTDRLGPEWRPEAGSSSNELLLYEGNKLVFKGSAQDFHSKFMQEYVSRLERQWKAFDLVQQMQQAFVQIKLQMLESLEDYTGDYTDTDLYRIWSEYKT